MNKTTIAAIILTKNEAKHIERCLRSLENVCSEVFVIDSFSDDDTCEIAVRLGAKVNRNPWGNYATQFNWALDNFTWWTDKHNSYATREMVDIQLTCAAFSLTERRRYAA